MAPSPSFKALTNYTGHSEAPGGATQPFTSFLTNLNLRTGFFVQREPRVRRTAKCRHCNRGRNYWTEKRVDTRLVADMIHYAAVDAYDVAVLFSGDQDLVPAVDAAKHLGRRVYVATWSQRGLSRELRACCFGEIWLEDGLPVFQTGRVRATSAPASRTATASPAATLPAAPPSTAWAGGPTAQSTIAAELTKAEGRLPWVSRWYFENRWGGVGLPPPGSPERAAAVQAAVQNAEIEEYEHPDRLGRATTALRSPAA
ncbi:MAG: NYN domain-containing protein [Candidatus Bipolaricaulota bacterium]